MKTLKDLLLNWYKRREYYTDYPDKMAEDLKASAIEDIKELVLKDPVGYVDGKYDGAIMNAIDYIMWKFNITEKDLEGEK